MLSRSGPNTLGCHGNSRGQLWRLIMYYSDNIMA